MEGSKRRTYLFPGLNEAIREIQLNEGYVCQESSTLSPVSFVTDKCYLYIPSFSFMKKNTGRNRGSQRVRLPKNQIIQQKTDRSCKDSVKAVNVSEPVIKEYKESNGESWFLKCVCGGEFERDDLVLCDICGNWQHMYCMGIAEARDEQSYVCNYCSNTVIDCKCGNNLDFRSKIVQCTVCGKYMHVTCNGMYIGMMPDGCFVCHNCGVYAYSYTAPLFPDDYDISDEKILITHDMVDKLSKDIMRGPLQSFINTDVLNKSFSAREFCQNIYHRFRSFFFISHPRYISTTSKKKRSKLICSILECIDRMLELFFGVSNDVYKIFETLINIDLFKKNEATKSFTNEHGESIHFSEGARYERETLNISRVFVALPKEYPLYIKNGEVVCDIDIPGNSLILSLNGSVLRLEEMNISGKIDPLFFAISESEMVLDISSHRESSILTHIKRGINGNCQICFFKIEDNYMVGLFSASNSIISFSKPSNDFVIKAGTPLVIGFDFLPAVIEDNTKWVHWQLPESSFIQTQTAEPKTRFKTRGREKGAKRGLMYKTQSKLQRNNTVMPSSEFTLFSLMGSEDSFDLLFKIENDLAEIERVKQSNRLESFIEECKKKIPKRSPQKAKGRPASTPKHDSPGTNQTTVRHTQKESESSEHSEPVIESNLRNKEPVEGCVTKITVEEEAAIKPLFNEELLELMIKKYGNVTFVPVTIGNPSKDMKDLLGL